MFLVLDFWPFIPGLQQQRSVVTPECEGTFDQGRGNMFKPGSVSNTVSVLQPVILHRTVDFYCLDGTAPSVGHSVLFSGSTMY